jgi:hypothetical protein
MAARFNTYIAMLIILFGADTLLAEIHFAWSVPIPLSALNSKEDDFAPSWNRYQNLLYFNSMISGRSFFYITKRLDSVNFSAPALLEGDINKSGENQSYITFISSENALFSGFRMSDSRSYLNECTAVRKKSAWLRQSTPKELQFNNFAAQGSVSPDGTIMVFATDMNSDFADTDLWIAVKQDNGSWGAISCITALKSPGNEITPFLASNDTLYFATDGQEGPGGYDIFMSVRSEGVWQRPQPMNEFNSEFDESDLQMLPESTAVFASNRPGGSGKLDLYISRLVPMNNTRDAKADIELSISTQMTGIKANFNLEYDLYDIAGILNLNHYSESGNSSDLDLLPGNIDTISYYCLDIIGSRMKTSMANLNIFAQNMAIAEKISSSIASTYSIDKDRFKILVNPSQNQDYIYFESDDKTITAPIYAGKSSLDLVPPVMELVLDARPRGVISKWECNWYLNSRKIAKCADGKDFPSQCLINLKAMAKEIASSDSINVELKGSDSLSNQYRYNLTLPVMHIKDRIKRAEAINGKVFEEYIVYSPDNFKIDLEEHFSSPSKKIIIEYFENSTNCRGNADKLAKMIKSHNPKVKTELIYKEPEGKIRTQNLRQNEIFRLLIEQ